VRTNSSPEKENALLDAMLRDETWQAASAAFKTEALRTYHARQRVNRVVRFAGSVAVLAAVGVGLAHWLGHSTAPAPNQLAAVRIEAPRAPQQPRQLTDQELVAAFPKGSCFIAEVDGKKELVFLDPKVERTYMAQSDYREGERQREP
jgi:hypothetical protein